MLDKVEDTTMAFISLFYIIESIELKDFQTVNNP